MNLRRIRVNAALSGNCCGPLNCMDIWGVLLQNRYKEGNSKSIHRNFVYLSLPFIQRILT